MYTHNVQYREEPDRDDKGSGRTKKQAQGGELVGGKVQKEKRRKGREGGT